MRISFPLSNDVAVVDTTDYDNNDDDVDDGGDADVVTGTTGKFLVLKGRNGFLIRSDLFHVNDIKPAEIYY